MVFEERKIQNKYITVFIAEEIILCSWLSPFHKQTASPFSPPTKMTANNIFLQPMNHFAFPLFIYNRSVLVFATVHFCINVHVFYIGSYYFI